MTAPAPTASTWERELVITRLILTFEDAGGVSRGFAERGGVSSWYVLADPRF